MASLKDIRTRIASVKSTRQITSAMKMVSAAKLRRAQDSIIQMRPYADKLQEILSNLSKSVDTDEGNVYAAQREIKRVMLVVVTGNRGLCGAFNSNVVKQVQQTIKENYEEMFKNRRVDLLCIGKKGLDALTKRQYPVLKSNVTVWDDLNWDSNLDIVNAIMQDFLDGKYDRVEVIYNQFKNAATQILTREQFLPIVPESADNGEPENINGAPYIFEPSKEYIVEQLIPKSLRIRFYKILLDSNAAEHGARMTAMHKATDNATEMLKQLNLTYNKARQAAITNEILEIVGGAEALKG